MLEGDIRYAAGVESDVQLWMALESYPSPMVEESTMTRENGQTFWMTQVRIIHDTYLRAL